MKRNLSHLLETRQDSIEAYPEEKLEHEFSALFQVEHKAPIGGSERVLYLLRGRP